MRTPTIAEENLARLIAIKHASQITHYSKTDGPITTVRLHTYSATYSEYDLPQYVDQHWHHYLGAARAIIELSQE